MNRIETICVDIGNSGMRCVRLDSADAIRDNDWNCVPWQGQVLRVDWPAPLAATEEPTAAAESRDANSFTCKLIDSLASWLQSTGEAAARPTARLWLVSSVQRKMESYLRAAVEELGQSRDSYRVVTYKDLDLVVDVDYPDRVGIDRLLAASAAAACCSIRPLVVVQAGSAITVDLVESPRKFSGGAILPGVPMMLRLLSRAADLLPDVDADELLDLPPLPGRNTAAAMSAGVSSAVVGGAQHLIARYRTQHGSATPVILSGGDGPRLTSHIEPPIQVVEHLVLRGLASLANSLHRQPSSDLGQQSSSDLGQ